MEDGSGTHRRVCAVCGRVLDYHVDRGWAHPPDEPDADHVAVPVEPGQVPTRGRCDFCSADDPTLVVPVEPLLMLVEPASPEMPDHRSDSEWSACVTCGQLIETNQWNKLTGRAVAFWEQQHHEPMPPESQQAVRRLHRMVRKHMRGPVRPLNASS